MFFWTLSLIGSWLLDLLAQSIFIFTPETILRWHCELIRCKWTFKRRRQAGRPPVDSEIEALIIRLAQEIPAAAS